MAGSEVAMTEHIGKDGPIERNYLMQDRPQSNTNSLNMGGLGLGSYVAGRFIDRVASPRRLLRFYGLLELIIGGH